MLSNFPAAEGDRLATESFVHAEIAGLRADLARQTTHLEMWMVGIGVTCGATVMAVLGLS